MPALSSGGAWGSGTAWESGAEDPLLAIAHHALRGFRLRRGLFVAACHSVFPALVGCARLAKNSPFPHGGGPRFAAHVHVGRRQLPEAARTIAVVQVEPAPGAWRAGLPRLARLRADPLAGLGQGAPAPVR